MVAEASDLAGLLAKRIAQQIAENHRGMDAGQSEHHNYMRLVGRNAQIREFNTWIEESMKLLKEDDDG